MVVVNKALIAYAMVAAHEFATRRDAQILIVDRPKPTIAVTRINGAPPNPNRMNKAQRKAAKRQRRKGEQ